MSTARSSGARGTAGPALPRGKRPPVNWPLVRDTLRLLSVLLIIVVVLAPRVIVPALQSALDASRTTTIPRGVPTTMPDAHTPSPLTATVTPSAPPVLTALPSDPDTLGLRAARWLLTPPRIRVWNALAIALGLSLALDAGFITGRSRSASYDHKSAYQRKDT